MAELTRGGGPLLVERPPMHREWPWVGLFLAGETAVLLLVVTGAVERVLPTHLATQVSHNSEAFLLAILMTVEVAWLRRRAPRRGAPGAEPVVLPVVVCSVALIGAGLLLLAVPEPRVRTLNEAVLAAGVLLPYCAVRPRRTALALVSPVVLAVAVVFFDTTAVRLQAESIVAVALAPIGLDVLARWVLAPEARARLLPAVLWTVLLLLFPVVLMAARSWDLGTAAHAAVVYAERGTEAFWGLAALHLLALVAWRPRTASEEVVTG